MPTLPELVLNVAEVGRLAREADLCLERTEVARGIDMVGAVEENLVVRLRGGPVSCPHEASQQSAGIEENAAGHRDGPIGIAL